MININMDKAKNIGHDYRRIVRNIEFAPYDAIISKQIPGASAQEAEAQRQLIREKYAIVQTSINNATNIEELTEIVQPLLDAILK